LNRTPLTMKKRRKARRGKGYIGEVFKKVLSFLHFKKYTGGKKRAEKKKQPPGRKGLKATIRWGT